MLQVKTEHCQFGIAYRSAGNITNYTEKLGIKLLLLNHHNFHIMISFSSQSTSENRKPVG